MWQSEVMESNCVFVAMEAERIAQVRCAYQPTYPIATHPVKLSKREREREIDKESLLLCTL